MLVGGTASALHAGHRFSRDADHVLTDLRGRFSEVLAQLEETELAEYKNLAPRWHDWPVVQAAAARLAVVIFDAVCALHSRQS